MSVIQSLREKYAKLTGGLVVVALLGFILMDYGRSGGSSSSTVGKIDGEKIDITEYDALLKETENRIRQQNGGQSIGAEQEAQLRDQVWQQLVNERILSEMNERLGVTITEAEVNNLLTGTNPDPIVRQQFTNPQTGEFNPQEVAAQIQQIKRDPNQKANWEAFVNDLKQRHSEQKAISLLTGSIYIPQFILDNQDIEDASVTSAQFVRIPYTSVADKDAAVSDADINKYIQAHPHQFKIPKTTRSIAYVSFDVIPSSEDSAKVLTALDTLRHSFATTDDVESFVNHNSQNAAPPMFYTKEQLQPLPNASDLMEGSIGTILGPFYDGGSYNLARILDKQTLPDSVRSRHILVAIKQGTQNIRSEEAAKARADSAVAALEAGVPFDSVALRFSDDPNSREEALGRPFTLMQQQSLTDVYGKDFSQFIFEGQTGASKLLKVELDNYSAYNYVQIVQQSPRREAVKLAFISRELNASDETYKSIYNKASQFAAKAATDNNGFEQSAATQGLSVRNASGIDANSFMINGLGSARDLVKWTYDKNTKVSDVSPIYTVDNDFVIAQLKGVQEKGLLKVNDQNRSMLQSLVMKEKKAKIIADRYATAPASLEAVAQKEQQPVSNLDSVRFSQSFTPGLGNEPKVLGYAFNEDFKLQTVSPAIQGNEGVYFLSVLFRHIPTAGQQGNNNNPMAKQRMLMSLKQSAAQSILNSMIERSNVKDMRGEIY